MHSDRTQGPNLGELIGKLLEGAVAPDPYKTSDAVPYEGDNPFQIVVLQDGKAVPALRCPNCSGHPAYRIEGSAPVTFQITNTTKLELKVQLKAMVDEATDKEISLPAERALLRPGDTITVTSEELGAATINDDTIAAIRAYFSVADSAAFNAATKKAEDAFSEYFSIVGGGITVSALFNSVFTVLKRQAEEGEPLYHVHFFYAGAKVWNDLLESRRAGGELMDLLAGNMPDFDFGVPPWMQEESIPNA